MGESSEDLFQIGVVGLLKAIEKFDTDRGSTFVAFAIPQITGEILNFFRDHGRGIKVPRELQRNNMIVQRTLTRLLQETGRWPTVDEIAHATGLSKAEVYETFEIQRNGVPLSLDAPRDSDANGDGLLSYASVLGDEDSELEGVLDRLSLETAMECLDAGRSSSSGSSSSVASPRARSPSASAFRRCTSPVSSAAASPSSGARSIPEGASPLHCRGEAPTVGEAKPLHG